MSQPIVTAPPSRAGRVPLVLGIVFIVLGVLGGIGSVVGLVSAAVKASDALTSSVYSTPMDQQLQLTPGSYLVYERVDAPLDGGSFQGTLTSSDVSVTGPDGSALAVSDPTLLEYVKRGGVRYDSAAAFEVPTAGTYDVKISGDQATHVIVGHRIASIVTQAGPWVGGVALFALLFVAGVILLIVGLVKRSRARKAQQVVPGFGEVPGYATVGYSTPEPVSPGYGSPGYSSPGQGAAQPATAQPPVPPALPPPGWYPDPARPGGLQYWDGQRWTGYTN